MKILKKMFLFFFCAIGVFACNIKDAKESPACQSAPKPPIAEGKKKNDEPPMPVEMVFVKGGEFDFHGRRVKIENFYISKYEVTREHYYQTELWAVDNDLQDELYFSLLVHETEKNTPQLSTWDSSLSFCNVLSLKNGYDPVYYADGLLTKPINAKDVMDGIITGTIPNFYIDNTANGYRLPTETEWEYAAIGGVKTSGFLYPGGNDPEELAWFVNDDEEMPISNYPVGGKKPNELGIYDMAGNALEWCIDYWNDTPIGDSDLRNVVFYYKSDSYLNSRVTKGGFYYDYFPYPNYPGRNLEALEPGFRRKNDLILVESYPAACGIRLVQKHIGDE